MTDTSPNFTVLLRDIWATVIKASRYTLTAITSVSWTHLAVAAIALAVVLTVVPLAIGLFAVFVVVKLCLNALESRRQRGALTPYKDVPNKNNVKDNEGS